ncbi:MAG: YbjN domain-containing protein [Gemmobacter sp.]
MARRPRIFAAALLAIAWVGLAGPVHAQNVAPAAPALVSAVDVERIATLIREAGFKAVVDKTDRGNPVIDSAAEGANFSIYFTECDNGADCWSIHYVSSFTLRAPVPTETINDWNRRRTIGQASRLDDGAAQIAHYQTLRHGVTEANFLYMFEQWRIALRDYMGHIGFR